MSVFYIGGFPPPFGGVTTKNYNLYIALQEHIEIEKIDFNEIKRKNLTETLRFMKAFLDRRNRFVVGVAGKKTRKNLCKLLYVVNRKAMRNSIIFLMGGTAANDIANDTEYQKYISQFKRVYAETHGMVDSLKRVGLDNADYYPNCRFKRTNTKSKQPISSKHFDGAEYRIHTVFFSRVCKEKGIEVLLETASQMHEVGFHIYGEISDDCKGIVEDAVIKNGNVFYHGLFKGNESEIIHELSKYDVVLLPTNWKSEGVPGILVESKIAGIPAVVSDICYNAEIVNDGIDGIVLKENDSNNLRAAILQLFDKDYLHLLSEGATESANDYYIDKYVNQICRTVEGT